MPQLWLGLILLMFVIENLVRVGVPPGCLRLGLLAFWGHLQEVQPLARSQADPCSVVDFAARHPTTSSGRALHQCSSAGLDVLCSIWLIPFLTGIAI